MKKQLFLCVIMVMSGLYGCHTGLQGMEAGNDFTYGTSQKYVRSVARWQTGTAGTRFYRSDTSTGKTCDGFLGRYEGVVRDHFHQCDAGITTGGILIDGSISACTSIRGNHIQGNIYKDNFTDVWENRFQKYRDRSWTKKVSARIAKMYKYCRGNGMHLYDDDDNLLHCDYHKMKFCEK